MLTNIKAWLDKQRKFKCWNYNKRYIEGYNFALNKLSNDVCIMCLVATSVGPDNHDEGLRDACGHFKRFYPRKLKLNCEKTRLYKV